MVVFGLWSSESNAPASSSTAAAALAPQSIGSLASSSPSASSSAPASGPSTDGCPVDHDTRAAWLAANPASSPHPFHPSSTPSSSSTSALSHDRVISSIPRGSTSYPSPEGSVPSSHSTSNAAEQGEGKWVYPSEHQFFNAMLRKQHKPRAEDMRTIVPIHNAVNEKAWEEVLMWEAGMGGDRCGGLRLISFVGRPKDRTPKAWVKTMFGYTAPFDRHDWVIDRCGTHIRYVIDFYTGKSDPNRPGNMAFYLDVRPAVDNWEGIRTRLTGVWR